MQSLLRRLNKLFARVPPRVSATPAEEVEVDEATFNHYSFVIGSVFSYFNDLSPESKKKFVQRVYQFRSQKRFLYIGLENNEDTAVLVSSSAIQIAG